MKILYDRHIGYMTAVCSRYVTDPDDVKDILQETFMKIFSSMDGFVWRGPGSLRAWMSRILVNDCLKFLKKNGRFDTVPLESSDFSDIEPDVGRIPPDEIQKMIRKLPVGYRTVFNLYVFEEKSHKEISELLGIKESSSASQLHRAKAMLAGWIKEYEKGMDR